MSSTAFLAVGPIASAAIDASLAIQKKIDEWTKQYGEESPLVVQSEAERDRIDRLHQLASTAEAEGQARMWVSAEDFDLIYTKHTAADPDE